MYMCILPLTAIFMASKDVHFGLQITSQVKSDLGYQIYHLNYLCIHVFQAFICLYFTIVPGR